MLETILQKYFNLPEDWNDDYEKQDSIWYKSYNQLIQLIYDLDELCGLDTKIIDKLDEICNEDDFEYDDEI